MKRIKKLLFTMLLIIVFTTDVSTETGISNVITVEAAVKKPTLAVTSKKLYLGTDAYQIKLLNIIKGAVITYSSKDKTVASVTKKGLVTQKKLGSTDILIIVKQSSQTYKLTLKVSVAEKVLTAREVYKKCIASMVQIEVSDKYFSAQGSGFFINKNTVVTNYHVIEGSSNIQVITSDNVTHDVKTIIGYNENLDLAILSVEADFKPLTISKRANHVGDEVFTLGSPMGLTGTLSKGMITTTIREFDDVNYIQFDAPISPGNSGGPLINAYGEVIGINTMYIADGQNLNFAINTKQLKQVITQNPITVAKYYASYREDFNAQIIQEDTNVSGNYSSDNQQIPSGIGVKGVVGGSNTLDYYNIAVSSGGWVDLIIETDNPDDLKNFVIGFDQDFNRAIQVSDDGTYLHLIYYMEPGYHKVIVGSKDGVNMPYTFFLNY